MKKKAGKINFLHHTMYPGGIKALREFVDVNLVYPEAAIASKAEGIVAVGFDIDYKGIVFNAHIKHGVGAGCDEEAIRIVNLLKYTPTKNRGLRVVFHHTLNINFNLKEYFRKKKEAENNKIGNQQKNLQISYTLTPTPSTKAPAKNIGYKIDLSPGKGPIN